MIYAVIKIESDAYSDAYGVRGDIEEIHSAFYDMCGQAFADAALLDGKEYSCDIDLPTDVETLRKKKVRKYGGVVSFAVLEDNFDDFIEAFNEWISLYEDDPVEDVEDGEEFFDLMNERFGDIFC